MNFRGKLLYGTEMIHFMFRLSCCIPPTPADTYRANKSGLLQQIFHTLLGFCQQENIRCNMYASSQFMHKHVSNCINVCIFRNIIIFNGFVCTTFQTTKRYRNTSGIYLISYLNLLDFLCTETEYNERMQPSHE